MVFRSGTIPSAGIGSRKKSPAEAGQGLILEEIKMKIPSVTMQIAAVLGLRPQNA
jgi:hypothetical protein